ncbi:hypothetical protein GOV09_02020 [Candidatus Woesearchaeota archaeon]|nr:hypothetical protein [Candidatus Woesearchaeota archaeon]
MVDKRFLDYMDNALQQYQRYSKMEKKGTLTFDEFLLLILTWKTEEILERLETKLT